MDRYSIRRLAENLGLGVRDIGILEDRVLLRTEHEILILPRKSADLEAALRRHIGDRQSA